MDTGMLESLLGSYVELDDAQWKIVAIDHQEALVSRELGGDHQCQTIDTSTCLARLVVDEEIELDSVGPYSVTTS